MGQSESCAATKLHTFGAKQSESGGASSIIRELQKYAAISGSTVPSKSRVQDDLLMKVVSDFLMELIIDSSALMTKKLHPLLLQLLNSSRDLKNEQLLLQASSRKELNLPELKGDHFQLGENCLENFTFYVRIGPRETAGKVSCLASSMNS